MSDSASPPSPLRRLAERLGLAKPSGARARIYLCEGPNCCTREESIRSWRHLKNRLAERGLDRGDRPIVAKLTECMKVCGDGPIAVVYPDPVWYSEMTPDRIDRVIAEHLEKGKPVAEFAFEPLKTARPPE